VDRNRSISPVIILVVCCGGTGPGRIGLGGNHRARHQHSPGCLRPRP